MGLLKQETRQQILRKAVLYARITGTEMLHTFYSKELGQPIHWVQDENCGDRGIIGQFKLDDGARVIVVVTPPCRTGPNVVSVIYVHEFAHRILGHQEQGRLLFAYTPMEAAASLFALGFLYVKSCPCGGTLVPHQIVTAIRKLHARDRGFVYPDEERRQDLLTISKLQKEIFCGNESSG